MYAAVRARARRSPVILGLGVLLAFVTASFLLLRPVPALSAGNTLTTVDNNADAVGLLNSVAVGTDGLPVISYYDFTTNDLKVAHCGNAACSAGNALTTVDSAGDVGRGTSVAVGADGLPVISYYDVINTDLKVAHCGNAACSAGNTLTTVDSAGDVGTYNSVAVGTDGLPVISYYDATNFDLKVAHCGNGACSAGNSLVTVDSAGRVGRGTSLAVGADGLPVIGYYDSTNDRLKAAHCGNAACSAGNILTTVDGVGGEGFNPSVTLGADGLPVISYIDDTNATLRVAHCGNAACSAGNTLSTVDSAGDVGRGTSVALGADGLPVISYFDAINVDLKVVHCGNAACSAGNTLTAVDSAGDIGYDTSVAVGPDGLPVISYFDATTGDLKVAHCGNAACSAVKPTGTPTSTPNPTLTTFTNYTGEAAGFLHVQSNITFGTLPSVNAPGCGVPTVFGSGFEYWEIVWPSPCVDPGESVSFELPTFTMIYGYYWTPSVPVVSAVHPAGPPSDYLRIATAAFIKGAKLVQNAPGCPPPAFQIPSSGTVELTWSSACVDPGEKVSIHIGAPGPVTGAQLTWSGPTPTPTLTPTPTVTPTPRSFGGVSLDPVAGGPQSQSSTNTAILAAAFASAVLVLGGLALFAHRRRIG